MTAPPALDDIALPVAASVTAHLDALRTRLQTAGWTNLGFPAATDIDYRPLGRFLGFTLNNLGDPGTDGAYPIHTKSEERAVINVLATLFGLPPDDRWGYVTSGATEGTLYALYLARTLYPGAIVYHSAAAHHSLTTVLELLSLPSITIGVDADGTMDYADLAEQLHAHRQHPAIVVANVGAAGTEALDDITTITTVLTQLNIRRNWIHADAALSGIPLALLPREQRPPGIDFTAGAHSLVASGHKFLGTPVPCAAVLVHARHHAAHARTATYTGSPDTTVSNSRSGLAALCLWYALHTLSLDGHRRRAQQARALAAYTHRQLLELGVPASHRPWAFTVSLPTPPPAVTARWTLASDEGRSTVICMPGIVAPQIDEFLTDIRTALSTPTSGLTAAARHHTGIVVNPTASTPSPGPPPVVRPPAPRAPTADPGAVRAAAL